MSFLEPQRYTGPERGTLYQWLLGHEDEIDWKNRDPDYWRAIFKMVAGMTVNPRRDDVRHYAHHVAARLGITVPFPPGLLTPSKLEHTKHVLERYPYPPPHPWACMGGEYDDPHRHARSSAEAALFARRRNASPARFIRVARYVWRMVETEGNMRGDDPIKDYGILIGRRIVKELERLAREHTNADNFRFCRAGSRDAKRYIRRMHAGCCGSVDERIFIFGKKYFVGCNYGH